MSEFIHSHGLNTVEENVYVFEDIGEYRWLIVSLQFFTFILLHIWNTRILTASKKPLLK